MDVRGNFFVCSLAVAVVEEFREWLTRDTLKRLCLASLALSVKLERQNGRRAKAITICWFMADRSGKKNTTKPMISARPAGPANAFFSILVHFLTVVC